MLQRAPHTAVVVLALALHRVNAQPGCLFDGANGQIDFSQLAVQGGTAVETDVGQITVNPCAAAQFPDVSCTGRPGATCCLVNTESAVFSCGSTNEFTTQLETPGLIVGIVQTGGTSSHCGPLFVSIAFVCDPAAPAPGGRLEFIQTSNGGCNTNLTWSTSVVCNEPTPPDLPPIDGENEGMSAFSTAIYFVVFLGGGLYFAGGTIVKSRLPNSSSVFYNNIPNREFWFDLPSLCKDGFVFALSGGKKKGGDEHDDFNKDPDVLDRAPASKQQLIQNKPGAKGGSGASSKRSPKSKPKPKSKKRATSSSDEEVGV